MVKYCTISTAGPRNTETKTKKKQEEKNKKKERFLFFFFSFARKLIGHFGAKFIENREPTVEMQQYTNKNRKN
jgi:hypothetical protein